MEFPGWGRPGGPTFATAEADLIRSIRHGTVGATLPEVTGIRLDGVEESLSDYFASTAREAVARLSPPA